MGKMKKLYMEEQQRIESLGFNPDDNLDDDYFFNHPKYQMTKEEKEFVLIHELAQIEAQKRFEEFQKEKYKKNLSIDEQVEEITKDMLNLSDEELEKIKNRK